MIISKTPYRISFAGGLSDLEDYYKYKTGHIVSTTIDKYIYVIVMKSQLDRFKVVYKEVEEETCIEDIKHPIVRACLEYLDIDEYLEIVSLSDAVGGSGLGSSSAFTVGLLHALYRYKGEVVSNDKLIEDACKIEIEILKEPIGKQDQTACTVGGLNKLTFYSDGYKIEKVKIEDTLKEKLQDNILLFNTGITRSASEVLTDQKKNYSNIMDKVTNLCNIAISINKDLELGNIDNLGNHLNDVWQIKKKTGKVTNKDIDDYYKRGIDAGAIGGKICGAGSGGFLMFYCKPENQECLRKELKDLKELRFNIDEEGTTIVYDNRNIFR